MLCALHDVNGAVWPLLEVEPATYRFRVLNGSNARTYRLVLIRDGEPELHRITQIGTRADCSAARRVPPDGLVLASAERADLLVDFSDLAAGRELTLGTPPPPPSTAPPSPTADARAPPIPTASCPIRKSCAFASSRAPSPAGRSQVSSPTDYRQTGTRRARRCATSARSRSSSTRLDGEPPMLTMRELVIADETIPVHAGHRHRR